jgi:hypothetical protein
MAGGDDQLGGVGRIGVPKVFGSPRDAGIDLAVASSS